MVRKLLAAICALTASACTSSYMSAVDMAPFEIRPTFSPVAEGLYCPVMMSWRSDNEVVAVMAGDADSCIRYSWDSTRRIVVGEALVGED